AERARLAAALAALPGVEVFTSAANFLLLRVAGADAVFDALLAQKVLVKNVGKMHPSLRDCLRVTVGTVAENALLHAALAAALPS
ncbi:MAG: histidinol-phosphate aminotransferase, partial [Burkholderiaceae bacterium]